MPIYLGKRPCGDLIQFESAGRPTCQNTGGRFVSAIGPFATRLGASYYNRYRCNPADADHLALEDPNPAWQLLREKLEIEAAMTDEELDELRQCEADEYEPDKPTLSTIDVTDMFRHAQTLEVLYQE